LRLYEGMVIVDDARCADDYPAVAEQVQAVLRKNGAQVQQLTRWDDRKLAYPIKGHGRGVYLLVHFNAPPESITQITHEWQLSDVVLRAMITLPPKTGVVMIDPNQPRLAGEEGREPYGGRPPRRERYEESEGGGDVDERR